MEGDEVIEFAEGIGAVDLRDHLDTEYKGLFTRRNYFLMEADTHLIVKISRTAKPWWGVGKKEVDALDRLTKHAGTYYLVTLDSSTTGWIFTKSRLTDLIHGRGSNVLSYSKDDRVYKVNNYNLSPAGRFTSLDSFLKRVGKPSLPAG